MNRLAHQEVLVQVAQVEALEVQGLVEVKVIKYNNIPKIDPNVPGALGNKPAPKQDANRITGS